MTYGVFIVAQLLPKPPGFGPIDLCVNQKTLQFWYGKSPKRCAVKKKMHNVSQFLNQLCHDNWVLQFVPVSGRIWKKWLQMAVGSWWRDFKRKWVMVSGWGSWVMYAEFMILVPPYNAWPCKACIHLAPPESIHFREIFESFILNFYTSMALLLTSITYVFSGTMIDIREG